MSTRAAGRVVLPPITRSRLDNGLRLAFVEMPQLPTVAAHLAIFSGSALNPIERAGMAALVADMLTLGTTDLTADQIAEQVDGMGATLASAASWDSSSISLASLSSDLPETLGLLAAMAMRPSWPASELEPLRSRLLAAIATRLDEPGAVASERLAALLYAGHSYGLSPDGVRPAMEAVTGRELAGFHESHWRPDNALLIVAGDVDPRSAQELAAGTFGGWSVPDRPRHAETPPPPPPRSRAILVDRPDLTQTQIRIGHEGIARNAPDWVAVSIMNYILGGGGFSSRLMDRIRVQRGYTYGISSQFAPRRSPGPFTISTFTPHAQAAAAVAETLEVVDEFRRNGPTEEEMEAAKNFHVAGYPRHFETPSGVASALLEAEVYGLGERELETRQDRFAAVTREEVAQAARNRLNPETPCLVLFTRAEEVAEPLRTVLRGRSSGSQAPEIEIRVEPAPEA